jgi:hypothetical protein
VHRQFREAIVAEFDVAAVLHPPPSTAPAAMDRGEVLIDSPLG